MLFVLFFVLVMCLTDPQNSDKIIMTITIFNIYSILFYLFHLFLILFFFQHIFFHENL